ncbi:MAG: hypothetical protein ACRELG_01265 [Gemmataceae bacterium]
MEKAENPGNTYDSEDFEHKGGRKSLVSPSYRQDIALRARRTNGKP